MVPIPVSGAGTAFILNYKGGKVMRFLKAFLALALVVLLAPAAGAINVGDAAVPFSLLNPTTSMEVSVPEYLGKKPGLIVFFNTSCGACEAELFTANAYLKKNSGAFKLIAIAIDSTPDSRIRVTKYIQEQGFTEATILLDPKFDVGEKYGFTFTPASVGIGSDGKVKFIVNGFSRKEEKAFGANLDSLK